MKHVLHLVRWDMRRFRILLLLWLLLVVASGAARGRMARHRRRHGGAAIPSALLEICSRSRKCLISVVLITLILTRSSRLSAQVRSG